MEYLSALHDTRYPLRRLPGYPATRYDCYPVRRYPARLLPGTSVAPPFSGYPVRLLPGMPVLLNDPASPTTKLRDEVGL